MTDTYESIVLLHGAEAEEAMALLAKEGEAAALAHLKRWHEPGEGTLVSSRDTPWKAGDRRFEEGRYVLYYDEKAPYIGLVCRVDMESDS